MGDYLALMMFPALLLALFLGFPVAFSMMGVALVFGLVVFDTAVIFQFVQKIDAVASNFVLAAVPLFIFMGAMLERSGIAQRLFEAVHLWTRRLPGGLAIGTIVMCVIFAASSGVIGATETVVGLLAIPVMSMLDGPSDIFIAFNPCVLTSLLRITQEDLRHIRLIKALSLLARPVGSGDRESPSTSTVYVLSKSIAWRTN